jgi:hypothetical protein
MFEILKRKRKRRSKSLARIISKELRCSRRCIYVGDKHIDPVSDKDMGAFMVCGYIHNNKYRDEIWDCDDHSLQFMAAAKRYFAPKGVNAAVGIIWTDTHAFNLSVNSNFKVRLWEPRTGRRCFTDDRVKMILI